MTSRRLWHACLAGLLALLVGASALAHAATHGGASDDTSAPVCAFCDHGAAPASAPKGALSLAWIELETPPAPPRQAPHRLVESPESARGPPVVVVC